MKISQKEKIRIGTLVNGLQKDPANYIAQILPHGFESFSINFWQKTGGVNLKKMAESVKKTLGDSGAVISSLGIYGNPLEGEPIDKDTAKAWSTLIDSAHLFGTNIVAGFAGRLRGKSIPDSMNQFKRIFTPIVKKAQDKGIKIAFENCDMGGNWNSGDWNIAQTPSAWEMIFEEIPSENLGLQWEPCHQMVKLIDPMPQLRKYVSRIFHVHGKDATIYWDVVREYGVFGPKQFAYHRTPGFGDSNWTNIISELRKGGFSGSIDIEGWHDPVYKNELEMTGQVHALNYLKSCRGSFVENPSVD